MSNQLTPKYTDTDMIATIAYGIFKATGWSWGNGPTQFAIQEHINDFAARVLNNEADALSSGRIRVDRDPNDPTVVRVFLELGEVSSFGGDE